MPQTDTAENHETKYASRALIETIEQLEKENEALRLQLWRFKRKPTGKIGYLILFIGAIALIWSVVYTSYVPAFVGIALVFWGALVLFIRPTKYMKTDLLRPTALPTFTAVNKMIKSLNYQGRGIYLPPKHFKGLKSARLFISSQENIILPPSERIEKDEIFLKNPQGMCLTPSGQELANLFEDELGADFSEVDLNYVQTSLPKLFVDGLEIAEDLEMNMRGNTVRVKIWNSVYKDLCSEARKLSKNACSTFACPLCSSIACALTRVTGKPVVIKKSRVSSDGERIEVNYEIIEE